MNKKALIKKFLSQFSWVFIGNLSFAISQWLVLIIISKGGSELDLGYYTYALAVVSPVFIFFTLDLRRVLATSKVNIERFHVYFLNRLIHVIIAFLLLVVISRVFIKDENLSLVILLLSLIKIFEYLSDIIFGYFQQASLSDLIGKSQLIRSLIFIVIFSVTYLYSDNIILTLCMLNIAMLFRLIFYDIKKSKLSLQLLITILRENNLQFKVIVLTNGVLGITLLIDSLIVNIPRYFLEYKTDIIVVGYFSSIYYLIVAASFIINPVTTMLAPILRKIYDKGKSDLWIFLKKSYLYSISISTVIVLTLIPFSDSILKIVYNSGFLKYSLSFKILLVTIIFQFLNAVNGLVLIMLDKKESLMRISFINLLIVVIFGGLLIFKYEILGASLSILLLRISMFILTLKVIRKSLIE